MLHPELQLLNEAMDYEGRPEDERTLVFYGPAVAHKVNFDVNVFHSKFMLSDLNRFQSEWGWLVILQNGTLEDVVTTLESYRPFLPLDQIDALWSETLKTAPPGTFPKYVIRSVCAVSGCVRASRSSSAPFGANSARIGTVGKPAV